MIVWSGATFIQQGLKKWKFDMAFARRRRTPFLPLHDLILIVYEDVPLHIHIQRLPIHPLKAEGADRLPFFELKQSFQKVRLQCYCWLTLTHWHCLLTSWHVWGQISFIQLEHLSKLDYCSDRSPVTARLPLGQLQKKGKENILSFDESCFG